LATFFTGIFAIGFFAISLPSPRASGFLTSIQTC
jgi:hypothetical protein